MRYWEKNIFIPYHILAKYYLSVYTHESYFLSLAVEEMGMNVIKYGFADRKSHSIDIKVAKQNTSWILRMRDDCPLFDPVHYMESFEETSPEAHIGIRMVSGMAKRMEYVNTLKTNNLLIEI